MNDLDRLADEPLDDLDEETLARIAALYAKRDPVPADLVERIIFGLALDEVYAEVAQLQREESLAGVRSGADTVVERITFAAEQLTVMVTVTPVDAATVRMDGWLAANDPSQGWGVKLRIATGERVQSVDEDGRFVLDALPRGLAQLVFTPSVQAAGANAGSVVTPTFELVTGAAIG
jgi:hypothetical protein